MLTSINPDLPLGQFYGTGGIVTWADGVVALLAYQGKDLLTIPHPRGTSLPGRHGSSRRLPNAEAAGVRADDAGSSRPCRLTRRSMRGHFPTLPA